MGYLSKIQDASPDVIARIQDNPASAKTPEEQIILECLQAAPYRTAAGLLLGRLEIVDEGHHVFTGSMHGKTPFVDLGRGILVVDEQPDGVYNFHTVHPDETASQTRAMTSGRVAINA